MVLVGSSDILAEAGDASSELRLLCIVADVGTVSPQECGTMILVNRLKHPVKIVQDNRTIIIPPSGKVARVKTQQKVIRHVSFGDIEIPVVINDIIEIKGLPPVCANCRKTCKHDDGRMTCHMQDPKVYYIVSTFVAKMLHRRRDLIAPDTSPESAIRQNGRIVAVRRLQSWYHP